MVPLAHGGNLSVLPIRLAQLSEIPLRCWPKQARDLERLQRYQDIFGFGAWDSGRCVGQLHCYRIHLPQWDESYFPQWARDDMASWPLGWPLDVLRDSLESKGMHLDGDVWGHACFHVGYTRDEENADPSLFGCGVATSLANESINWARQQGYAAVLAMGGPMDFFEASVWMGVLPWSSYARMGFRVLALENDGKQPPWWLEGASPEVVLKAKKLLAHGRRYSDLCFRAMLLPL